MQPNKIYFINVRTLKIRRDKTNVKPKKHEFGRMAPNKQLFVEKFVNWVDEVPGRMHKTFNTSAKKDVVKFILDKQ